ncbi:methyltransferase domain-containing protein [Candidatus Dojkabacteria bacterium]|nr:methyltransferase domain-containing protein [Candidatus Dojkabacteria bacterium]
MLNKPRSLFRRYIIKKHLNPGKNFLEIGPGDLKISQLFLTQFHKGTCIDINQNVNALYNQLPDKDKKKLKLIINDFVIHKFKQTYSCIIACEVLEHVPSDKLFLKKIYSLLDKQGQAILSVPAKMNLWNTDDELAGHLRRYEKTQLKDLLSKIGFKKIKIFSYGFPFTCIIRIIRIYLAKIFLASVQSSTQKEKTKLSGIDPKLNNLNFLNLILNQLTFLPLNIISSPFNQLDLSDGYILFAEK